MSGSPSAVCAPVFTPVFTPVCVSPRHGAARGRCTASTWRVPWSQQTRPSPLGASTGHGRSRGRGYELGILFCTFVCVGMRECDIRNPWVPCHFGTSARGRPRIRTFIFIIRSVTMSAFALTSARATVAVPASKVRSLLNTVTMTPRSPLFCAAPLPESALSDADNWADCEAGTPPCASRALACWC